MTYNKYRGISDIMQLRYVEHETFLAFDKPYDIRTHQVADGQFGFVEFLNEKIEESLFVVHRLDKGTSGIILFARSREAAADLGSLFEKHLIEKTYYFLTHRKISATELLITSHIEKQNGSYYNIEEREPNSETQLQFIKSLGVYDLWQAKPKTGKPHQIRLHAEKAGVPILGDEEHGGKPFFRLALHAGRIEFSLNGTRFSPESPLTPIFTQIFEHPLEAALAECLEKRRRLYTIPTLESFRLVHNEIPDLRADIFGDRLWVYDYSTAGLTEPERQAVFNFASAHNLKPIVRHMLNRGQGVGGLENSTLQTELSETSWTAPEEGVHYNLKTDAGFSPGVFLDQRENRLWIRANSKTRRVLNLFSYTSGFSVNAALGGAQTVTTVDVSKKFLDWSRENFALNGLKPEDYEFFAQDTLVFLKGSVKRGRKWDLIICDPPSFGRSKDAVWKLESGLPELADLLLQCLAPKGKVLFTCNLEKRTRDEIIKLFSKNLKGAKPKFERTPMMSLDYEITDDLRNVMKGFLVSRA